jgi:hypothetical protein
VEGAATKKLQSKEKKFSIEFVYVTIIATTEMEDVEIGIKAKLPLEPLFNIKNEGEYEDQNKSHSHVLSLSKFLETTHE